MKNIDSGDQVPATVKNKKKAADYPIKSEVRNWSCGIEKLFTTNQCSLRTRGGKISIGHPLTLTCNSHCEGHTFGDLLKHFTAR